MNIKINLRPEDQSRVLLFSNKGEAIVFWLSISALIFLAVLLGFRYFAYSRLDFEAIESSQSEIFKRIQYLEEQNKMYENNLEKINFELKNYQNEVEELRNKFTKEE